MGVESPQKLKTMISKQNLLLSFQILLQCDSSPAIDAMMRATMNTTKKINKAKQCQLLVNLKQNDLATNDIQNTVRRLQLSTDAKRKLKNKLTSSKIHDAYREKRRAVVENAKTWNEAKRIIPGIYLQGYADIHRKYSSQYAADVSERHRKKFNHLQRKWKPEREIPDIIEGIDISACDAADFPPEFSSEPRLYGDVELDEDEKMALELPVKYGLFRELNITQCKIDIEESLNKLRWGGY